MPKLLGVAAALASLLALISCSPKNATGNSEPAVTPNGGTGDGGTFSFVLPRVPGNASGLTFVQVLFGNQQSGSPPFCFIHYDASTKLLKLYKGPGVLDFTGAVTPGAASQPLVSDTCSIDPASSSVAVDNRGITMKVALKFQPAMQGDRVIYWRTFDGGSDTGWRRIGTWNVTGVH